MGTGPIPLVTYVLVNWRTEELLPRALGSIAAQTYGLREIIVVNNGSEDFDEAALDGTPGLTVIQNDANRGFAAANNQGIQAGNGDFFVLVNCDAYLDPAFTELAAAVFRENERIGTVVPKILKDDRSGIIDSAGHRMHLDRTTAHIGRGEQDQGQYDRGGFVFGGTAAAIAYRREMLETAADGDMYFDETFFAYYEDVDLDWRARLAGFQAFYEPRCLAFHRGHGSGGRKSYKIQLTAEKNRYLMLAKNDTLGSQWARSLPLLVYEAWHLLKTILRPWLWPAYLLLLYHLPGAIASRVRLGRNRTVDPAALARRFERRGLQPPTTPALPSAEPRLEPAERRAAEGTSFPLVSAIVLNYNGLAMTKSCIAALLEQTYEPFEIIVVDNGSATDEADILGVEFPGIRTLRLERNHGFAGGVNWGLTLARGRHIVLVNNDCQPHEDCIRNLVYAQKRTGAQAVSGRLIDVSRMEDLDAARHAIELEMEEDAEVVGEPHPRIQRALAESRMNHGLSLYGFTVTDLYGETNECFYPSGGLCLLTRQAVEPLLPELFPHWYFAYREDVHLGYVLRKHGGWIAKEPRAVAVHLASSTARRLGHIRLRYLQERNRWLNLLGFTPRNVLTKLAPMFVLNWISGVVATLLTRPLELLGLLTAHIWLLLHPLVIRDWRAACGAGPGVDSRLWLKELSGQVHGRGGLYNRLSVAWCRLTGIPCRETQPPTLPVDPSA